MTLVRSASFSGSCIALTYAGNCSREEGGSFLIWHNLDVVFPWVVWCELLHPWFLAGNGSISNCPFFCRLLVIVVRSFFNVKLGNVNIGSPRGGGLVRRDSGSVQFP